jgi:hypothetical protein
MKTSEKGGVGLQKIHGSSNFVGDGGFLHIGSLLSTDLRSDNTIPPQFDAASSLAFNLSPPDVATVQEH